MADNLINVIDPDTQQVGSIPQEQLADAQSQGFSQATPEQTKSFLNEQKYGSLGQNAIGAVEQAASAASFGGSEGLETGLGLTTPEAIAGRKEQLGTAGNIAAQTVGLAATNLIPGVGEAADVEALAKAGKTAEEIATAAKAAKEVINPLSAASVMSGTAEKAVQALGIQNPIAAGATKMAIESAMFQGGNEVSKMFEQDPDQTLGTAVTDIGLAGLLGAPLGAVGGGISSLLENSKLGQKISQGIEDFRGRMKEHLETPDPLKAMNDELAGYLHVNEEGLDVYGPGGLKAEAISKLMPNQLSDKMVEQAQGFIEKAKNMAFNMEKNPDLYPRNLSARFQRDLNIFSEQMSQPANPEELFNGMQELKQRMQQYIPKKGEFIPAVDPSHEFINDVRGLGTSLKKSLEDPEIWGKAANVQQDINKAFSEYMPALKDFKSKFTSKIQGEPTLDQGKIQTYLNQTGKAGQNLKKEMLGNFIDASEKFRSAVNGVYEKIGSDSSVPIQPLHYTKSTLNELTAGAKLADVFLKKGLSKLGGEALGTAAGAGVGHAFGMGWIGALIGEHALAPFFNSILPAMIKPLMENQASAAGFKSAAELGVSTMKGEALISRASKNIFKAGADVLPSHLIPDEKQIKKLDKTLSNYQVHPEQMTELGGATGHYLPGHATALGSLAANAVNSLNSLRPVANKANPLDAEAQIPKGQQAEYERSLSIAEQPLLAMKYAKEGQLQPRDLAILKQLYPALIPKMVGKLTEDMTNHLAKGSAIPYKTRMGLSMLMGQPLDSTMTPQGIMAAQGTFQQNVSPTQNAPEARGGKAHSMKALSKLGEMDELPSQKRESARVR